MSTPQIQNTLTRCRGCRCTICIQIKTDTKVNKKMLEKLSSTKVHEVSTGTVLKIVNLCGQDLPEEMELSRKAINDS